MRSDPFSVSEGEMRSDPFSVSATEHAPNRQRVETEQKRPLCFPNVVRDFAAGHSELPRSLRDKTYRHCIRGRPRRRISELTTAR